MKTIYTAFTTACLLMVGCTCNPANINKAQNSLRTTQAYYDVLVDQLKANPNDVKVRNAVVSADVALSLAGALQGEWCPPADMVDEAARKAGDAKVKAMGVGVNP